MSWKHINVGGVKTISMKTTRTKDSTGGGRRNKRYSEAMNECKAAMQ